MSNKADTALMAIRTPGKGERDYWVMIGAAYKAAGGTFEVWDSWSSRDADSYSPQSSRDVWNSLKPTGGITERTLYGEAIKQGWKDTENESRTTSAPHSMAAPPQTIPPPPPAPSGQPPKGFAVMPDPKDTFFKPTIREQIIMALSMETKAGAARAYLKGRGFTDATIDRFQIGFYPSYVGAETNEPRAIIPYPGDEYFVARRLSDAGDRDGKKYLYPPKQRKKSDGEEVGGKRAFNVPALTGGAKIVYIVEGQLDAMTIEQEGGAGIGCNEPQQMLDALEKAGGALTAKTFVIIPDADENGAGAEKAAKMQAALEKAGKDVYIRALPDGVHDCNDSLKNPGLLQSWIAETPQFIMAIKCKEFNAMTGGGRLAAFVQEINESAFAKATPTGFGLLDSSLDGGLWPGLYIIGAISSLGKTTFALQIIDQVAKDAGRGCLVFSLEMAAHELMAKSISRITDGLARQDGEKKTMRGITAGARYQHYSESERALINAAFAEYAKFAGNVCIVEGQGEMDAIKMRLMVEKYTVAHDGQAPVILVDYLQIVTPADPRATDKQNADRAVTELKRIARDFKTPVIAISSFNRDNYSVGASMAAFKESGAIEYSSDVLLALQLAGVGGKDFNVDEAKKEIPRKVELVVLKNRNGQTGAKIPYDYDARFNVFRERGITDDDLPLTAKGKPVRRL